MLSVEESFEYGIFVVAGSVVAESTTAEVDQLVYLGNGRRDIRLRSSAGGRVIMLGGQPLRRGNRDVVELHRPQSRGHRGLPDGLGDPGSAIPPIVSRAEKVMEAPPMPTITLKPRPRRSRAE